MEDSTVDPRAAEALAAQVHVEGGNVAFGEMTREQVIARAEELKGAGTWGPMQRVIPVARAWGELGKLLTERELATVGQLAPGEVTHHAERTWVLAPAEGMI